MQQPPDNISSSHKPAPDNTALSPEDITRLFAQSPVAIGLLKGPDMIISAINNAMLTILGIPADAVGKKLADAFPSLASESFAEIVRSVYQTDIAYSDYEYQLNQQRNGSVYEAYYTFSYNPYHDQGGQTTGVIITAVEVTPRAVLNQRVAESEAQYRRLIENSPVAMYACNRDGYVTQFNKAAVQLFGRELRPGTDRWTPAWKMAGETGEYIAPENSPMAIALKTGKIPEEREITLQNADGTLRVILDHPQLFLNEEGKISGGLNAIIDITERKISEKNAASLAAIIHSTDDAIISKNLDGIIMSWNPAAVRLFGYREEEAIGTPVTRLFPADRMDEEPHIIDRIKRGERIEHFETVRIRKSGEPIDISLTISPIKDASGRIIGASKIAREITAQKVLFKALQESEQKFRELVMQAPVGITILKGPDMIAELANDTYLQIVDRTREQFIGKSLYESLPEVRSAVEPLLTGILHTGIPYYGNEFKVNLKRHGRVDTTYFNFVYQPLKELDGKITGIIVVANEVTEQVEAKHYVTESAKEFRRMVMESPIAMTIFRGPDFVIEVANTVLLKNIWRLSEEEVMGRKALEVFPELIDQKYPELLRQVMTTGQAHRENESVAFVHGADGMKKFYLDYEYAPLFEPDGSVSGIMITVNDVTEKVEARHKVEDAEARLRLAAEGTGLATWDLNLVTKEIIHTPRLAEIFGFDRAEQV
ncbi:MAG: PAS domain-containing protein, partial [Chitinophagaceae bacterium]|nr:PAS domain-containing protein [Chitinophagaceae bacterium]